MHSTDDKSIAILQFKKKWKPYRFSYLLTVPLWPPNSPNLNPVDKDVEHHPAVCVTVTCLRRRPAEAASDGRSVRNLAKLVQ